MAESQKITTQQNKGHRISEFCDSLDCTVWRPVKDQAIVELILSSEILKMINSTLILPGEKDIRRMLCRLKSGKLLKWHPTFMNLIDEPDVIEGTILFFNNKDGDIQKHPDKNIFYKIIESCDVKAFLNTDKGDK